MTKKPICMYEGKCTRRIGKYCCLPKEQACPKAERGEKISKNFLKNA